MIFTLSWLRLLLNTNVDAQKIADTLGQIGFEVEERVDKGALYSNFVIAEIIEAHPHPDADKLRVCRVNDGRQELQIVCGAPNARAGIKVVLAPVGTMMPVDNFMIKSAKIRGVESNGMMCSAEELGLPELTCPQGGIVELPESALVGGSFKEHQGLDEVIFDISITPNRGDALSMLGLARDLAAAGLGTAGDIPKVNMEEVPLAIKPQLHMQAADGCPSFSLRRVEGVKNDYAPDYMARQLRAISSASYDKGALVAISNYAMFTYGRPNHIYDAAKVEGDVYIRYSKEGERFIALGGQEYTLPAGLLIVADSVKVLAIAGVMGGELSKVDEQTRDVLIEMAEFSPIAVAQAGRALNLLSDSRYRFERRIDPANGSAFMDYITDSVLQHCGGQAGPVVSVTGVSPQHITDVWVNYDKIRSMAGIEISNMQINEVLTALGFYINHGTAKVPSWRWGEVGTTEDLAEEVLRIYGYHQIPQHPIFSSSSQLHIPVKMNELAIKEKIATQLGLHEVMTWSFANSTDLERYQLKSTITVDNPINNTMDVMRPSIIPNLVKVVSNNIARGTRDFGVFEYGSIYADHLPDHQTPCIAGVRVGHVCRNSAYKDDRAYDFFDVKADLLVIAKILGCNPNTLQVSEQVPTYYHPGQSASFTLGNKLLGLAGILHPAIAREYDIDEQVAMFEVFPIAFPLYKQRYTFGAKQPDLPVISRDFAFVLDESVKAADIVKAVNGIKESLLEDVNIFDVYRGKGIEDGKKSIAFSVRLQPWEHTMTEIEIERISSSIIAAVQKIGGVLR